MTSKCVLQSTFNSSSFLCFNHVCSDIWPCKAHLGTLRSQSHIQVTRKTLDCMSTRIALHWALTLKVISHLFTYGYLGNRTLRN